MVVRTCGPGFPRNDSRERIGRPGWRVSITTQPGEPSPIDWCPPTCHNVDHLPSRRLSQQPTCRLWEEPSPMSAEPVSSADRESVQPDPPQPGRPDKAHPACAASPSRRSPLSHSGWRSKVIRSGGSGRASSTSSTRQQEHDCRLSQHPSQAFLRVQAGSRGSGPRGARCSSGRGGMKVWAIIGFA